MFVKVKLVLSDPVDAVTVYVPINELALTETEHAPWTSVVQADGEKVAPAAVKATVTPVTGRLPESVTVTCSGNAKAVETCALCPPPPAAVTEAGGVLITYAALAAALNARPPTRATALIVSEVETGIAAL